MAGLALAEELGALTVENAKSIVGRGFWNSLNLGPGQVDGALATIASFLAMGGASESHINKLKAILERNYARGTGLTHAEIVANANPYMPRGRTDPREIPMSEEEKQPLITPTPSRSGRQNLPDVSRNGRQGIRNRASAIRENLNRGDSIRDVTRVVNMFPNESDASLARLVNVLRDSPPHIEENDRGNILIDTNDGLVEVKIDDMVQEIENDGDRPYVSTGNKRKKYGAIVAAAIASGVAVGTAYPHAIVSGAQPPPSGVNPTQPPPSGAQPTQPPPRPHLPQGHHRPVQPPQQPAQPPPQPAQPPVQPAQPPVQPAGALGAPHGHRPLEAGAGGQGQVSVTPDAPAGSLVSLDNPLFKYSPNQNYDPSQSQMMKLGIAKNSGFDKKYMRFGRYKFPKHGTFKYQDIDRYINGALYKNVS